jgi:hypothetical protein
MPSTNTYFPGIVLERTQAVGTYQINHTGQAPERVVCKCLLADDALQALDLHWNRMGKQRHKVWAWFAPFLSF